VLGEDFLAQLIGFQVGLLLGGYRLEECVGTGGMAVVFRARDERLGRLVALKILAPALAADRAFRRRFIAESRAAAAVDDPHIIPVYEAGEADGVLFIAMRLVQGRDLRRVLERDGALPSARAAEFVSPVASALDAAHGIGLVHRDVKPANILVDARPGRPDHVYLSDFGVSKGASTSVSLTVPGQFLGTPDYSAPEQIQGRVVDGRTDQYALACVAYELLTGATPFERDQGLAVVLAHLSEPPPSVRLRRPELPAAADLVLAQALAKASEKRYESCIAFADALRGALGLAPYHSSGHISASDHRQTAVASPLSVFPGPAAAETGKAAVPADLAAAATIDSVPSSAGLPAAAVIVTGPAHPDTRPGTMSSAAAAAEGNGIPAIDADGPANRMDVPTADQPRRSNRGSGDSAQSARRPRHATVWIRRHRLVSIGLAGVVLAAAIVVPYVLVSSPSPVGSRSSVSSPGSSRGTLVDLPTSNVTSVAFSPNGGTLAVGGKNGRTYLWDIAARKLNATLTDPGGRGVNSVAFSTSPDGVILATADSNGRTYLWNIATRKVATTLTDPGHAGVNSIAFGPDGVNLVTVDSNGSATLWDVDTRKVLTTFAATALSVAFSPNGHTMAFRYPTNPPYGAYVWTVSTAKVLTITDPGSTDVEAIAYSPDSETFACADGDGDTYLWNIASGKTGKLTATLADPSSTGVNSIAYAPNGVTLAAADNNGSTYVWNIAARKVTAALTDPGNPVVRSVAFSPDGATLATLDDPGHIYLWSIG
jgi:serine/threonine protein kinase/WD40 repeat protein